MGFKVFVRERPLDDGRMPLVGEVDAWTSLEFTIHHNMAGSWKFMVPVGQRQEQLLTPGRGVVIFREGVDAPVFSGTVDSFERYWTLDQHTGLGSMYVSGKDDNQLPYDYVVYPGLTGSGDTSRLWPLGFQWQGDGSRVVRAPTGKLIWNECRLAFGPDAVDSRGRPWVNTGRSVDPGTTVQDTLRFDNLGEKFEKWWQDKNTGFRFLYNPRTQKVDLTIAQVRNMTGLVRFSKELGNVKEYTWTLQAPSVSRVIVACQGEGKERYLYLEIDADGEQAWGQISEAFVDRRDIPLKTVHGQPDLVVKLDEQGNPDLGKGPDGKPWPGANFDEQKKAATDYYLGVVKEAAKQKLKEGEKKGHFSVIPIETPQCKFGRDYRVGDIVVVEADGQSVTDKINEVTVSVESGDSDAQVSAKIGSQGSGEPLNLYKQVFSMMERIRLLESRI